MAATQNQASLYVGDLHPEVNETQLFDLFKPVGPVLSIRVCRDNVTRRSLGYGYVNFQNPADAERALEALNYHKLKDVPIRLMWSQRDPSLRKSGNGNVFIKNLHKDIDNQTLYDTFSQFGNILSCKVATDPVTGESLGYGFVHFEDERSAQEAVNKVHNKLLMDREVYVAKFVRRSQRIAMSMAEFTNCYLKNFKDAVTEEQLRTYLGKFGEISSLCLKTDRKGRPFAFCDFKEHVAADQACAAIHDNFVPELCGDDKEWRAFCQRAQKKSERMEELKKKHQQFKNSRMKENAGHNLYVKNLDDNVDDKALREAFEKFGQITSATIMTDERGQSKGFGFVCFKDLESANKAIAEMNGALLGAKPLYVNVAQRKEVRRATLEIQYATRMGRGLGGPGGVPAQGPMGYPMAYGQPTPPYGAFGAPPPGFYGLGAGRGVVGGPKWAQQPIPGFPGPHIPGQLRPLPQAGRGRGVARGPIAPAGRIGGRGRGPAAGIPAAGLAYTKQARNRENFPGAAGPGLGTIMSAQPQLAIPGASGQEPLTAAMLAEMSPEQQKNTMGERLFVRISETHPEHAAKITGMLLEMDISEQLNLLESPELLHSKIMEALEVLKSHSQE